MTRPDRDLEPLEVMSIYIESMTKGSAVLASEGTKPSIYWLVVDTKAYTYRLVLKHPLGATLKKS